MVKPSDDKSTLPADKDRKPKSPVPIHWLGMAGVMAGFLGGMLLSMNSQTDRIARVVKIDNAHLAVADTSPVPLAKRPAPAVPKTVED
jgi:hypothetical protein